MRTVLKQVYYHMRSWRSNFRIWAAFLLGAGLCLNNISGYLSLADGMGYSVQPLEAYIILGSRIPYFMGILLGSLLLLSDAPFVSLLSSYEAIRIGRIKWVIGQMVYIFFSCIIYSLAMLLLTSVVTILSSDIFLSNRWSDTMTLIAIRQPVFVTRKFALSFDFPDFINSVTPVFAVLLTLVFNTMYMVLVGWCILVVNLLMRRNPGWLVAAVVHIVGYIAYANGGIVLPLKASLLCCAAPAYHYVKELKMPPLYSFVVLTVFLVLLLVLGRYFASRLEFFS